MINLKKFFCLNQIGQKPQSEDSIYPAPGKASITDKLFLVCDGVGGENMGEEGSRIACEEFANYFQGQPPKKHTVMRDYIDGAQRVVLDHLYQFAQKNPLAGKMSTTLTLAYLRDEEIFVAWCGDSRVYHMREGKVLWKTTDHSMVASLVRLGEITEEESRTHPKRNMITRSLSAFGDPSEIDIHILEDLQEGDYILLCTDGVLEEIDEERLKEILLDPSEDKEGLFMAYCQEKTYDNYSLYLLEIGG